VQSRQLSDAVPQDVSQVSLGSAKEGFGLNVGGGASNLTKVFQVNVTATYTNAAVAELEARLNRSEVVATGY
jgi:hypothetical protein